MTHRLVRMAVIVLYAAGLAAAAYQLSTLGRQRTSIARAQAAFHALSDAAADALAALRAAQQSYVAVGQDVQYRITQAADALGTLGEQLVGLKRLTTSQESATAVGAVAQTVDNITELDERVREYAANGQVLMASDIIFTDGVEMLDAARERLDAARDDERVRGDATVADLERRQATLVALMAGVGLLVAAVLLVTGTRPSRTGTRESSEAPSGHGALGSLHPTPTKEPPDADVPSTAAAFNDGSPPPPMEAIASLCCDLARVQDAHDLPNLLARGARLLDATGVIVWLTAPGGGRLLPALTHGYDAEVVKRMGTIARDADNATASAYRTAELRTVPPDGESTAAIVAPLVGGHGCVGAMALEVAAGAERDVGRRSLASIVATQLAVLVSEAHAPTAPAAPSTQESRSSEARAGSA